ncbi:MAG: hypothetical protein RLZZ511_1230 [Cyanobacteriota bacterium]|jgi:hypothetical protein
MSNLAPYQTPTTTLARPKSAQDIRMETERMQDVVLLLERLAAHDETTVKLIMDCLYDVGSVHFANQKVANPALNHLLRASARMSKPVFRLFAVKWFQKNCPQMIADWLYTVATFQAQAAPITPPPETIEVMRELEVAQRQVRALQMRVKCLTGLAVGLVVVFGGAMAATNFIPQAIAALSEGKPAFVPPKFKLADRPQP